MKLLSLLSLICAFQFVGHHAHAFKGHDQFKVDTVKPWGEFGFRAQGRGMNITEIRFDCSQSAQMGLVLTVVNKFGKTSHTVLPVGELGSDKHKCQNNLKKYFASIYSKRGLASSRDKGQVRTVEVNFSDRKILSFR